MLYYSIALCVFVYSLYGISTEGNTLKKNKLLNYYLFYSFILLFIILGGLRWETGTDWFSYLNYFEKNSTWRQYNYGHFEVLFAFFNFVIKQFSSSYTCYLLIFAFITIYIKGNVIDKIALYPALSLFFYFCIFIGDIFATRQVFAISILMISINTIHNRRKIQFLVLVFIATLMHTSSIIWIFSYYIYHKKFSDKYIICIFLMALFVGVYGVMNVIRPLFSWMLLPFSSNAGISRALLYLDLVDPTFSPISMLMSIIKRLIIIPFFLLVRKKLNTTNEYMKGLLNFYLFGNLITLVFINGFAPIQRLASPFLYMEIFIIPALLKTVKNTYIKYLVLMLMVLYGLLKLYVLINGPYKDLYTPYYSVFDRVTREAYSHYK